MVPTNLRRDFKKEQEFRREMARRHKENPVRTLWLGIFWGVLACLFAIVVFFHYVVLPILPIDTPKAEAHEVEVIHDNAYYCANLMEYSNRYDEQIISYCNSL